MSAGKTRSPQPPRRKKGARSPPGIRWLALVALALILFAWWGYTTFEERHWRAFTGAGRRAQARGHYAWSAKMYHQALKEAQRLGPPAQARVVESLLDLSEVYEAQNRPGLARTYAERARALRRQKKKK